MIKIVVLLCIIFHVSSVPLDDHGEGHGGGGDHTGGGGVETHHNNGETEAHGKPNPGKHGRGGDYSDDIGYYGGGGMWNYDGNKDNKDVDVDVNAKILAPGQKVGFDFKVFIDTGDGNQKPPPKPILPPPDHCPMACLTVYDPVCASNGMTFNNYCELQMYNCKNSPPTNLVHYGSCDDGSGSGGGSGSDIGVSPVTGTCDEFCPDIFAPICGSNGMTFDNLCYLDIYKCKYDSTLYPVDFAPCDSGSGSGSGEDGSGNGGGGSDSCDEFCPTLYAPVCGSNGMTFDNMCYLEIYKCKYDSTLHSVHSGPCDSGSGSGNGDTGFGGGDTGFGGGGSGFGEDYDYVSLPPFPGFNEEPSFNYYNPWSIKYGHCPIVDPPEVGVNYCRDDSFCPPFTRCCFTEAGRECTVLQKLPRSNIDCGCSLAIMFDAYIYSALDMGHIKTFLWLFLSSIFTSSSESSVMFADLYQPVISPHNVQNLKELKAKIDTLSLHYTNHFNPLMSYNYTSSKSRKAVVIGTFEHEMAEEQMNSTIKHFKEVFEDVCVIIVGDRFRNDIPNIVAQSTSCFHMVDSYDGLMSAITYLQSSMNTDADCSCLSDPPQPSYKDIDDDCNDDMECYSDYCMNNKCKQKTCTLDYSSYTAFYSQFQKKDVKEYKTSLPNDTMAAIVEQFITYNYKSSTEMKIDGRTTNSQIKDKSKYKLKNTTIHETKKHHSFIFNKTVPFGFLGQNMHRPHNSTNQNTKLSYTYSPSVWSFWPLPPRYLWQSVDSNGCCPAHMFHCPMSSICLHGELICDGVMDCSTGDDENNCGFATCKQHQCDSGQCVAFSDRCDGVLDCSSGEDEDCTDSSDCPVERSHFCSSGQCVHPVQVCNNIPDCSNGEDESMCPCFGFKCKSGQCISHSYYCDNYDDCDDGDDEVHEECIVHGCQNQYYLPNNSTCSNGKCLISGYTCDGYDDCGDNSDEDSSRCSCDFQCGPGRCIENWRVCNGIIDCAGGVDENNCTLIGPKSSYEYNYDFYTYNYNFSDYYFQDYFNTWDCDGFIDKPDGSDEENCVSSNCPESFRCSSGYCIEMNKVCNGIPDCRYGEDESDCDNRECQSSLFHKCRTGQCLWLSSDQAVCDGYIDCFDGSDEENCSMKSCGISRPYQCTNGICINDHLVCDLYSNCLDGSDESTNRCQLKECDNHKHRCDSGQCVYNYVDILCNGYSDCSDNSDELSCSTCSNTSLSCGNNECYSMYENCNQYYECSNFADEIACEGEPCAPDHFKCTNSKECIPNNDRCNNVNQCNDGSDEENCEFFICPSDKFKCVHDHYCINGDFVCDGYSDCNDGSDEENCEFYSCPSDKFKCVNDYYCVKGNDVCDGSSDCLDGSDEEYCNNLDNSTSTPI